MVDTIYRRICTWPISVYITGSFWCHLNQLIEIKKYISDLDRSVGTNVIKTPLSVQYARVCNKPLQYILVTELFTWIWPMQLTMVNAKEVLRLKSWMQGKCGMALTPKSHFPDQLSWDVWCVKCKNDAAMHQVLSFTCGLFFCQCLCEITWVSHRIITLTSHWASCVSNHRRLDCLPICFVRHISNKTSKLPVTWPVDSPHKGPVTRSHKRNGCNHTWNTKDGLQKNKYI